MALTFGKWLKDARKLAGLTQDQLAKRAGCTHAYISALEREVVESKSNRPIQPSLEIVDAIARALGAPSPVARRIAGYHVAAPQESESENQLVAYFRDLPPCLCRGGGRRYILFSAPPQPGHFVLVPGPPIRIQAYRGQPCLGVLVPFRRFVLGEPVARAEQLRVEIDL